LRTNIPCATGFCVFVPMPPRPMATGEFVALLVKDTFCEEVPANCGLNVNEKDALCPAARVSGNDNPLIENGALTVGAVEIVTLDVVALRVADLVEELPTATLPKLIDAGEIDNVPFGVAPVPLTATTAGEFDASLANEIFCEAEPFA
jgi:hypothetical protein